MSYLGADCRLSSEAYGIWKVGSGRYPVSHSEACLTQGVEGGDCADIRGRYPLVCLMVGVCWKC